MTNSGRRTTLILYLLAAVLTLVGSIAEAKGCNDTCLRGFAHRYMTALRLKDPYSLPLAPFFRFTENGQWLPLTAGLWESAAAPTSAVEYFTDEQTSTALVVAAVDAGGSPAILSARIHVNNAKLTELETIVARKGSHPLFSPDLVTADSLFFANAHKRHETRRHLIAIANTYFDGIEQNSGAHVLATDECDRFENGTKTTHRGPDSGGCAQSADAITWIKHVTDRRCFLAQPSSGVVACTIIFDIPGGDPVPVSQKNSEGQLQSALREPRNLLLTEVFKIDDGRIQRIQAIMQNRPHGSGSGWSN